MSASASAAVVAPVTPAARDLQEKLHDLLSRLAGSMDHVKNWPEATTDTAVHVESTTRLIHSLRGIVTALERVERQVVQDDALKQQLQNCPIPVDLLELLDCGLNPDCYVRGLLREVMGQLSGLKRRKQALEMLGAAVQKGLDEVELRNKEATAHKIIHARDDADVEVGLVKRERDEANESTADQQPQSYGDGTGGCTEPPSKKPKLAPDVGV